MDDALAQQLQACAVALTAQGVPCRPAQPEHWGKLLIGAIEIGVNGAYERFLAVPLPPTDGEAELLSVLLSQQFSPHKHLFVSSKLKTARAGRLRSLGLNFVDTRGFAHVEGAALLVATAPRSGPTQPPVWPQANPRPPGTSSSRASAQVGYVLLRDPSLAAASVRELAVLAGVSHGSAAFALRAFEERGWLAILGRGRRSLVDATGLLDAWLLSFPTYLQRRMRLASAVAPGHADPSSWAQANASAIGEVGAVVGGEVGAAWLGVDLRGGSASVYVQEWGAREMRALKLAPSPSGTILVQHRFSPLVASDRVPNAADELLVLSELVTSRDSRVRGAALELRGMVAARLRR